MDSFRHSVPNWSAIDRQLIADWSATKSGGFDRTVVSLVAADFSLQSSRRQVAVYVWPGLYVVK